LIRDVLHNQICGIDVNKAALQVTAFSLYLAALEVDPAIEEPLELLRFDRLIGRSLYHADFLQSDVLRGRKFDVIVGNPPWTYAGKRTNIAGGSMGKWSGVATPSRSPDWRFLWRARQVSVPDAWIALLMKATPFFSKARLGGLARQQLFASFKNVRLINMSQLRGEHLFPSLPRSYTSRRAGASGSAPADKLRKPNLAPALLFVAQAGRQTAKAPVLVANMPWSRTFRRHGLIQNPGFSPAEIGCDQAATNASLLKAFVLGNSREAEVMCNLAENRNLVQLGAWLLGNNIPADQGFQSGGGDRNSAEHLVGLPQVTPETYKPVKLPNKLPVFEKEFVHRPRDPGIYRAPLVLCPEGSFSTALEVGRYSAALSNRDVAFSDSIVGISFGKADLRLAKALVAVLNSKVVAFQLAFGASNIGIKQPKVEKVDLEEIRIPDFMRLPGSMIDELAGVTDDLSYRGGTNRAALRELDRTTYRAYGIKTSDLTVIDDVFVRSRPLFLDSDTARRETVKAVSDAELTRYAAEFASAMDSLLAGGTYLRTCQLTLLKFGMHVLGFRFTLASGGRRAGEKLSVTRPLLFEGRLFQELGGSAVPKFHASRRYVGLNGADVYILKPDERRLWRPSDAQSDAKDVYLHERLGALRESTESSSVRISAQIQ
jgi:hypothetical protein